MDNIDLVARSMAAQAKATAAGTTNGETVDARTGADAVARASLGAMVREIHQGMLNNTTDIASGNTASSTLAHGLSNIVTSRASEVVPTLSGRTLVNLLGRVGNCDDNTKWKQISSGSFGAGSSIDTTNAKYGSNALKIAVPIGDGVFRDLGTQLSTSSYYLIAVDLKMATATGAYISLYNGAIYKDGSTVSSSSYGTSYKKLQPSDIGATQNWISIKISGGTSPSLYMDGVRVYEITAAEYALIDVDANYTGDKLADKFPYVDSVKHVVNPMLTKQGKNLLPPFTDWTLHANAVVIVLTI
jgi:hypothetical protein